MIRETQIEATTIYYFSSISLTEVQIGSIQLFGETLGRIVNWYSPYGRQHGNMNQVHFWEFILQLYLRMCKMAFIQWCLILICIFWLFSEINYIFSWFAHFSFAFAYQFVGVWLFLFLFCILGKLIIFQH